MTPDFQADAERLAAIALAEDGPRDITSELTVAPEMRAAGAIEYRSDGTLAGTLYASAVARACGCAIEWRVNEGATANPGALVGTIRGALAPMLRAERPILNLLQRASGIASATRAYVREIHGTRARILHTRKTAPGLRGLDVAGVLAGGGQLHRLGLADTVMVKDNHWRALEARGLPLGAALDAVRARGVSEVEVEVEDEAQLEAACAAGATRLLIDNQSPETLERWSALARRLAPKIEIEATGGVTLQNVRAYALAGADFISVGALTHSVRAADIALEVEARP